MTVSQNTGTDKVRGHPTPDSPFQDDTAVPLKIPFKAN